MQRKSLPAFGVLSIPESTKFVQILIQTMECHASMVFVPSQLHLARWTQQQVMRVPLVALFRLCNKANLQLQNSNLNIIISNSIMTQINYGSFILILRSIWLGQSDLLILIKGKRTDIKSVFADYVCFSTNLNRLLGKVRFMGTNGKKSSQKS